MRDTAQQNADRIKAEREAAGRLGKVQPVDPGEALETARQEVLEERRAEYWR